MTSNVGTRTLTINLPPLHKGQLEIDESPARFKVVICGRRFGKTTLGILTCLKGALRTGGVYLWVGPNYPEITISRAWPTLKQLISQIPGSEVRESDRCVILPNGGEIWIKSADNPESLRGGGLRGVVLDEVSQIAEETWTQVLRPALMDHRGWALFIGTPKGKNWVYNLFQKAQVMKGWAAWRKPTWENPYISREEIEDMRNEMSEAEFKQEVEADFGVSQHLVFPDFNRDIHQWKWPIPEFQMYFGGLDFGGDSEGNHKSAGAVAGLTNDDELVLIKVFEQGGPMIGERQMNWIMEMESRVRRLPHRWGYKPRIVWCADKTQMWGISLAKAHYGLHIFQSKGGKDSIIEGNNLIHRRLKLNYKTGRARLFYLPELHQVPDAFERYHNHEWSPDRPTNPNPIAVNDDLNDAIRYLVEKKDRMKAGDPQEMYAGQLGVVA